MTAIDYSTDTPDPREPEPDATLTPEQRELRQLRRELADLTAACLRAVLDLETTYRDRRLVAGDLKGAMEAF